MEAIGRDREVADVVARVESGRRLITIVGPGGIGKTTLARAAAAVLEGSALRGGPGDRRLVELARVDHADAVPGVIAAGLGFASFDALLGSRGLAGELVTLDNCEHVLDAVASTVEAILVACPTVVVLATSRSPLAVAGESLVTLASLAVPAPGLADRECPSVRLFCERALDAGAAVEDDDLEQVGELCRRLDGLPLAIELAAARTRSLGLTDLLVQTGDGVDVLRRVRHRGAGRHRSLRDTIAWSVDLLDEHDRLAFAYLAVCPGRFDARLAAGMTAHSPDNAVFLDSLVDASLVTVERRGGDAHYRLLEPVRFVARETLVERGELDTAHERLANSVLAFVTDLLERATQSWWAELLPDLMDNFDRIALALRHCVDFDDSPERAKTLYMVLWGALHQGRVDDVLALGELVLGRWPTTEADGMADVVATSAMGQLLCGHSDEAERLARDTLPNTSGSWAAAIGLRRVLALAARYRGDHHRAATLLEAAASAAARSGAPAFEWECLTYRAQDVAALGRIDEALRIVEEIAADSARRGSIINEIWARTVQAAALASKGTPDALNRAERIAGEALSTSERIGYPFGVSCNLQTITLSQLETGDLAAAAASADRLLDCFSRAGLGDFRRALEIAAAVLHVAGHRVAADLSATARQLPNTNPMVMHHQLPSGLGSVLTDRAVAARAAHVALAAVLDTGRPKARGQPLPAPTSEATFARAGDVWDVTYAGTTVRAMASKGMDDLAVLLAVPDRDVHCVELAGAAVDQPDTGEVIDGAARRRYESRVRELQAEIDEADGDNDIGRAERARAELDALVDHLTAALATGGRTRSTGSTAERARSAVTHRVRAAIDRLAQLHPQLGRHLQRSVRTGTYCSYRPDPSVTWDVRAGRA